SQGRRTRHRQPKSFVSSCYLLLSVRLPSKPLSRPQGEQHRECEPHERFCDHTVGEAGVNSEHRQMHVDRKPGAWQESTRVSPMRLPTRPRWMKKLSEPSYFFSSMTRARSSVVPVFSELWVDASDQPA